MSEATKTLGEWTGHQVVDTGGAKIGTVQDIVYDDSVEHPEWLVAKTGLFGKKIFIPARDVRMDGGKLIVPYTRDRAKDAPHVARDDALSQDEERELYLYYGLDYPEPSPSGVPPAEQEKIPSEQRDG